MSLEQYITRVSRASDADIAAFTGDDGRFDDIRAYSCGIFTVEVGDENEARELQNSSSYAEISDFTRIVEVGGSLWLAWKAEMLGHWKNCDAMMAASAAASVKLMTDLDDNCWHLASRELVVAGQKHASKAIEAGDLKGVVELEGDGFMIAYDSWF